MTQLDFLAGWVEPRVMPSEFAVLDEDDPDFEDDELLDEYERIGVQFPVQDRQTGEWSNPDEQ